MDGGTKNSKRDNMCKRIRDLNIESFLFLCTHIFIYNLLKLLFDFFFLLLAIISILVIRLKDVWLRVSQNFKIFYGLVTSLYLKRTIWKQFNLIAETKCNIFQYYINYNILRQIYGWMNHHQRRRNNVMIESRQI